MRVLSVLVLVGVLSAAFASAEKSRGESCTNSDPWPYKGRNYLTVGQTLAAGSSLESKTAILTLSDTSLQLVRKRDGRAVWTVDASTCPQPVLTFQSTSLALSSSDGTSCWSTSFPSSEIAVVMDHCAFQTFQKAPMTNKTWASGTAMCVEAHVVPHSHDDVGWLLTPERYYDGCQTPGGGVRGILDTIMQALTNHPNRTFNQVESYYFNRWWNEKNETVRNHVRQLVAKGQLVFLNGGWSMHDEACVHQESAISNMEVGARFLKQELGVELNIGWHIDPFGHASTTPRIMAEMGFDAFFFWRTDYEQRAYMVQTKTVESMWSNSPSRGDKTLMFTSIMYDNYCYGCGSNNNVCPSNFFSYDCMYDDFTTGSWASVLEKHNARSLKKSDVKQLQRSFGFKAKEVGNGVYASPRIQEIADGYAELVLNYEDAFRTGHVLLPWGCDFMHESAVGDYEMMEQVMDYINANYDTYGIHIFYSTAQRYVKDVQAMNYQWPVNEFDYFLDSDDAHSYWSGYLSSRAEYKGYERMLMNERSSVDVALSAVPLGKMNDIGTQLRRVEVMREAMGVAQHHDSITGTERTPVRNQYQFLLNEGYDNITEVYADVLKIATGVATGPCKLANLSYCPATTGLGSELSNVSVYVFNPLAQPRTEILTIPVPVEVSATLMPHGTSLTVQTVATWELTTTTDNTSPAIPSGGQAQFQAYIQVTIPPLSLVEILLQPSATDDLSIVGRNKKHRIPKVLSEFKPPQLQSSNYSISNEFYTVSFDGNTNRLIGVTNLKTGQHSAADQNIGYYCPNPGGFGQQADGAYIMRTCEPNSPLVPYTMNFNATVVKGPLCSEVRQEIDARSNIHQAFRLCKGMPYVEVQSGIGEVSTLGTGVEVIMQLRTDVDSNKTWYTDSQALEMQPRVRNSRPNYPYTLTEPVASNFFPCNAFAYLNGTSATSNVAVMGDRSRATASLMDGELEFLVQRRLIYDDGRGVNEPLDETTRVLTTSRMVFNSDSMLADMRLQSLLMTHRPIVRFGAPSGATQSFPHFSFPNQPLLPPQVHLHTRTVHQPGEMIVRLQHLFAIGEGDLGVPVQVDLSAVIPPGVHVLHVTDMDMNAVKVAAEMHRVDFPTCIRDELHHVPAVPIGGDTPAVNGQVTTFTLHPMEIRVFKVNYW